MSRNVPCRNPQLCGVQSHRPGTVAQCASNPSAEPQGARTALPSAPPSSVSSADASAVSGLADADDAPDGGEWSQELETSHGRLTLTIDMHRFNRNLEDRRRGDELGFGTAGAGDMKQAVVSLDDAKMNLIYVDDSPVLEKYNDAGDEVIASYDLTSEREVNLPEDQGERRLFHASRELIRDNDSVVDGYREEGLLPNVGMDLGEYAEEVDFKSDYQDDVNSRAGGKTT